MKITIQSHTHVGNYDRTPTSARLIYKNSFVNGDNETITKGDINGIYAKQVSVSYSSGVSTISAFSTTNRADSTLVSTTSQLLSTAILALYDANGAYIDTVFDNIKIPDTPTTTTWANLDIISRAISIPYRAEYMNREETQIYINNAVATLPDELSELGDVDLTSPADGDILTYDGANWINAAPQPTGIGSHFFDATKLQSINHGPFWRPGINYSHFLWEAWVKPYFDGSTPWTGYVVSDNQGGAHNLLWGCTVGSDGFYNLTGNIHDGTTLTSFNTSEHYPANHWAHWAVGWDGSHWMFFYNGVLVYKQAYSSGRKQNGGNDFCLHVAGSDHNNFWGWISQIRAFEGYGRCAQNSDFTPELYFRPLSATSTPIRDACNFYANYTVDNTEFVDDSIGFEGMKHSGVKQAVVSTLGTGERPPAFNDYTLPSFTAGEIAVATHTPTAPTMPVGAKVWDSFSRPDVTYLNSHILIHLAGDAVFGQTEGGSLGPLTWTSEDQIFFPNAGAFIISGRAAMPYNGVHLLLETGLQDVDIRVDRIPTTYTETSIFFRYKDANNNYKIWGGDTSLNLRKVEAGVVTDVSITPSSGWTTLRVVASGTSINIYTGASTTTATTNIYSNTITNLAGSTKHGLYNQNAFVKTVYSADNFCIL